MALTDVRQRVTGAPPEVWAAAGVTALLLLYGNAMSGLPHGTRSQLLLWSNLALLAGLLAWSRLAAGMTLRELGLDPRRAPASALFGLIVSVLAAAAPVLFIVLAPLFNGGPVEAEEITSRSGGSIAYFLLFRQPIGTALFEEVAFRGVLYGAWLRAAGERTAFVASSAAFALWHLVISSRTVIESGVVERPVTVVAGVAVTLLGLFVGGLIFAYLRWHTRNIAAPAVAHWLIVALMTVAVWAVGRG